MTGSVRFMANRGRATYALPPSVYPMKLRYDCVAKPKPCPTVSMSWQLVAHPSGQRQKVVHGWIDREYGNLLLGRVSLFAGFSIAPEIPLVAEGWVQTIIPGGLNDQ